MAFEQRDSKQEAANINSQPNSSLLDEVWQGMKKGGQDELQYNAENLKDSGLRATVIGGIGYLTSDAHASSAQSRKIALLAGTAVTTAHFFDSDHLQDMADKNKAESKAEGFGYAAGRFLTDASMTLGIGAAANKTAWTIKGNKEIAAIIDTESERLYYNKFGMAGDKNRWARVNYSTDTPIFRQERGEQLADLLKSRNQTERLDGLLAKISEKPEPEAVQRWSSGIGRSLNVPQWNPEAIKSMVH